jgi:NAD(P)-dependent dehydrogenase (short-subunit alcohol dehydrogenase family)
MVTSIMAAARRGETFLVTGANAGIGYHVAEQLATTGATVVLGSRSSEKPDARVRHLQLDLADLDSLKTAAGELDSLDAVVCNGGVMIDDAELMYATNHLGHFVLVHWLMPHLAAAQEGRVVTKTVNPDDADARSKQAQMLFGFELHRRQSAVLSVVNHPGGALDSLTPPRKVRSLPAGLLLQGKDAGAWPAGRARPERAWRPDGGAAHVRVARRTCPRSARGHRTRRPCLGGKR